MAKATCYPALLFIFISVFEISYVKESFADTSLNDNTLNDGDVMKLGIKLNAPTPQPEKYYNDLIHPCVRYIPEGICGHKWWMVATPYRGGDALIENPILYYGENEDESLPPLNWTAAGIIQDTPLSGYNSDPNLYFDGQKLWIFWRENGTPESTGLGFVRACFGRYTTDGINFSEKKYFAGEESSTEDSEMCPTIIEFDGKIRFYGVKHEFSPIRIPLGLTLWEIENNDLENNTFSKLKDLQPIYRSGFDLWHTDFFIYQNLVYCVATPEAANEILLGVSNDGENFTFWNKPLLSTRNTRKTYLYKASAMVKNGIFYLWNPVAEEGIYPRTTRIWMSEINFEELLLKLNDSYTSINTAPTAPVSTTTTESKDATTPIAISWNPSTDVDNDAITYTLHVYGNSFDKTYNNVTSPFSIPTNTFAGHSEYDYNITASDGKLSTSSLVNILSTINHVPTKPVPISPNDSDPKDATAPITFTFMQSSDADNDQITYKLDLYGEGEDTLISDVVSGYVLPASMLKSSSTYDYTIIASDGLSEVKSLEEKIYTKADILLPGSTSILSPANNSANIPLSVYFAWAIASNTAKYNLEVATDTSFTNIINDIIVSKSDTILPENANRTYYARVRGENTTLTGPWSNTIRFTTINTVPTAICNDLTIYLNEFGHANISVDMINNGSSGDNAIDTMYLSKYKFDCADIGDNLVVLTVVDEYGAMDSCSSIVTLIDTMPPVVSCVQPFLVQLDETGQFVLTVDDILVDSYDECGIDTLYLDNYDLDCDNTGITPVGLTAVDVNGNWSYCVTNITVYGNVPPVIQNDSAVTLVNTPVQLDIVANDYDNNNSINISTLQARIQPQHGAININAMNGLVTYTPAKDFVGRDTFTYSVCDDVIPCIPLCGEAEVFINVINSTKVSENLKDISDFKIYPNPTDGILNIEVSGITEKSFIKIVNALGQVIRSIEIMPDGSKNIYELDISDNTSGVYTIILSNDQRVLSKSFILN